MLSRIRDKDKSDNLKTHTNVCKNMKSAITTKSQLPMPAIGINFFHYIKSAM